jgi:hypothetical protein
MIYVAGIGQGPGTFRPAAEMQMDVTAQGQGCFANPAVGVGDDESFCDASLQSVCCPAKQKSRIDTQSIRDFPFLSSEPGSAIFNGAFNIRQVF